MLLIKLTIIQKLQKRIIIKYKNSTQLYILGCKLGVYFIKFLQLELKSGAGGNVILPKSY